LQGWRIIRIRHFNVAALLITACVLVGGTSASRPADIKAAEISEITVARLGGDGLPADILTFHSGGSATYEGKHGVERIGRFKGNLPDGFSGQVFPLLAGRFAELASNGFSFGKPTHGLTPVLIRVKWAGGVKEFTDWCPGLDERAWACEMLARGVASEIAWTK
jgi:hypothetical protein